LSEGGPVRDTTIKDNDYGLWWLFLQTRRAFHRTRVKELFQYGITAEEARVLFIVHSVGRKATPAEISRWTLRASHTVSGLLIRMEKKGLIRKVHDLDRKNMVRVVMTRKGRKAYSNSAERVSVHQILSCLSEEEFQQLRLLLEKLLDRALKVGGIDKKPRSPEFK